MYKQPVLEEIFPKEVHVGRLSEVYVNAKEDAPFWQRKYSFVLIKWFYLFWILKVSYINNIFLFIAAPPPTGEQFEQYGIKCKFGRFGSASATYINRTTILCLTPNTREAPSEVTTETVEVTVAMNGVDYNEDSQVTIVFVGTGQGMSIMVVIMGTLIFALLILSILVFLFGMQTFFAAKNTKNELENESQKGSNQQQSENQTQKEGGQPFSALSIPQTPSGSVHGGRPQQRSDSAAGGAGGRLARANGGSRDRGPLSRQNGNSRGVGSRHGSQNLL